ncbi:hypothetical protein SJAV_03550 [Sulfurisphaera javensis]|uniref:Uncharacterized protein n=1 Tax=Sulfurisphaera javensis TaxID=2049879 RepID=A0AAT9GNL7_9CREN
MAVIQNQEYLNKLDKTFKIIFIIGLIVIFAVAIAETQNYNGFSPTPSQVATVGYIVALLLVIAGVIYSQFPPSVLGKPIEEKEEHESAK